MQKTLLPEKRPVKMIDFGLFLKSGTKVLRTLMYRLYVEKNRTKMVLLEANFGKYK